MRKILLAAALVAASMTIQAQTSAPSTGAAPDAKSPPGSPMMTPEQQKARHGKMASMKDSDCGKNMGEMRQGQSMEEMHTQMHERMAAKDDKSGPMGSGMGGAGKGGCGMMDSTTKK